MMSLHLYSIALFDSYLLRTDLISQQTKQKDAVQIQIHLLFVYLLQEYKKNKTGFLYDLVMLDIVFFLSNEK